ncbi:YfbM family protein [Streptomyces sp. HPF1205]|uniref:YfbM family protein n=1 Tax=Streptomyces sp. HPF1205 TaxID=2873262 RepID=UPI001CEC0625|nr:YfbM family protein [Streptomyces sp. HPF1205]
MSMIGEYARLTPAELERAVRDPAWALEYVDELIEAGAAETTGVGRPRCLDIDKAWDTLGFLLRRIEFPVDIVHGEEEIPGAEDWGYGPPRYLLPERVHAAAAALGELPADALVRGVTEEELARADLYPRIADEGLEWLTYVTHHYEALVPFFQAAAAAGDAMVVWLD